MAHVTSEPMGTKPARPRTPYPPAIADPAGASATATAATAATGTRSRRFWALVLFGYFTVFGLFRFGYKYLEARIRNPGASMLPALIDEMTAAWGAALLFALTIPFIVRFPLTRATWPRRLPLYVLALTVFSFVHTAMSGASRAVLYPLVGLRAYDYGSIVLRVPMELSNHVIFFWLFVAVVHGFLWYRELRDRDVATARLAAELSRAQLDNLRERIHPHFLFNTLNAISAEMYRDVDAADRMISRLSDLLRTALDTGGTQETTLARELELLDTYLEIMRLRFGERLTTRIEADDDVRAALVPVLLLQPLVENAIRHGVAERAGSGEVVVRAGRVGQGGGPMAAGETVVGGVRGGGDRGGQVRGELLRIEILDDGPGFAGDPGDALRSGVGLSTTAARLRHLHGEAASLRIENRAPRGARVIATLPWREGAAEGAEASAPAHAHAIDPHA